MKQANIDGSKAKPTIKAGSRDWDVGPRPASNTKKGPGRRHLQGKGKKRG